MRSSFIRVCCRELRRLTERRIYGVAVLGLPLFCLLFMATVFGGGGMDGLPVGIVDADQTAASRRIVRSVEASPALKVTRRYTDEIAAKEAVSRKRIYGYLYIPPGFERRMTNGNSPVLTYYYHNALLSVGGEVHAAFERLLKQVSAVPIASRAVAAGIAEERVRTFLLPVEAQNHAIYNPTRNYTVYLAQPFFFVMLQVLVLLVTVYALGSETKSGTAAEWLRSAGGDIGAAVLGKLLPYGAAFACVGVFANFIFFGVMRLPLPCGWTDINLLTVLFILATQALAVTLFALFPTLEVSISLASMIGSLGATLSGVTFPVEAMYAPVRWAALFFPARHFTEAVQGLLYGGGSWTGQWENVCILSAFLLPPLVLLPRLKAKIVKPL